MSEYRYTESGLDNVIIGGVSFVSDDAGVAVIHIPNVNGLHHAIAYGIVTRPAMMNGKEMRFLRSEMGMTQAELASMIHREPLTISRWERGETEIDANAETLIRLYAIDKLNLDVESDISVISGWSIPSAVQQPIKIDGSNPKKYKKACKTCGGDMIFRAEGFPDKCETLIRSGCPTPDLCHVIARHGQIVYPLPTPRNSQEK